VVGTLIGLSRLSSNWLLSRLSGAYVEIIRDIPCLLHLLLWYQILLQLPAARHAINLFDVIYLSNRGLWFPTISFQAGVPTLDFPHLSGFNFTGGTMLTPELAALVIGLSIYSSCFVAEIVRAGVQGVARGQWEASAALGLRPAITVTKVILPQALRIIIPPLGGEYLNVIKNSSLAVVIGYSDLTAIVDTMLSDTGQAIEAVAILMLAYLAISIVISLALTWYNRRVAIVTR
jgi:general L-amino acid transport system permease protein